MNLMNDFQKLGIDTSILTDKKQQTDYKIKYVSEYVKLWSIISAERNDISEISFIDCMCNSGVYKDGDCCTSIEVLSVFLDSAMKHKNKKYRLYLNDINEQSVSNTKKIVNSMLKKEMKNISVYYNHDDVNYYLERLKNSDNIFGYGKSVILYIDPYDFGTVHIPIISEILKHNYCEVIFNFFVSDYVRNIKKDKNRIKKCIGNERVETKDDIVNYMKKNFRVGNIQYSFSYQFKTKTNVELYQIIFVTPNIRGLEKLKEVLWKVFAGKEFHRNYVETGQMSLFTEEDETKMRLEQYSNEAKNLLYEDIGERTMPYDEIEALLIENTMLMQSQIISNVLKPLVSEGRLIKLGNVSSRNYKGDLYKKGI